MEKKRPNREKIMDAALQVFADKGFQQATISEISKAAGLTDPTLYEYFGSKEDLLFEIACKITSQAVDSLKNIFAFIPDPASRVRVYIQLVLMAYQQNPNYAAVGILDLKTNRRFHASEAYKSVQESAAILLNAITDGIEAGVFRQDLDPYLVRSMVLGIIEHICTRKHLLNKPMDLTQYTDKIFDLFLNGTQEKKQTTSCPLLLNMTQGVVSAVGTTEGVKTPRKQSRSASRSPKNSIAPR